MDEEPEGKDWEDGKTRPRCKGSKRDGTQCAKEELPDLGYCFQHAPEELIPQAEQLSGKVRCSGHVTSFGPDGEPTGHTKNRCGNTAIPGGKVCKSHGGNLPAVKSSAFEVILNQTAAQTLAQVSSIERNTGLNMRTRTFQPIRNPFEELMMLAGEMREFKDRIGAKIDAMEVSEWRYEHSRAGEQLRAELLVYINAMDQLTNALVKITKLNLEERMMRINERLAEIIEQAFARTVANPEFELQPDQQKKMKEQFGRRLRVA